jgi:DNA excision repair protein ERCC-3
MNPSKFMACQYLIEEREKAGDKIIVFSDNVYALMHYAEKLGRPYIYGKTGQDERQKVLHYFRQGHPKFRTIFLSKVGDTSLDLPEATCLIQISSQFGSRRQEAQRMGRILRAKRRNEEGFRSRFFTLVSRDTDEVAFSSKRKRFLIDQGYEFKMVPSVLELIPKEKQDTLFYSQRPEQLKLLELVKSASDEVGEDEVVQTAWDDLAGVLQQQGQHFKKKKVKGETRKEKKEKNRNPLFKQWKKGA